MPLLPSSSFFFFLSGWAVQYPCLNISVSVRGQWTRLVLPCQVRKSRQCVVRARYPAHCEGMLPLGESICSWSNTGRGFGEHTKLFLPSSLSKDAKSCGPSSLLRPSRPLKPMAVLHDEVYFILGGKQSQFYTSPGAWQELQGWIYAVGCLCCPPSGLNPPLSTPDRNTACIHQPVALLTLVLPKSPFLQKKAASPASPR